MPSRVLRGCDVFDATVKEVHGSEGWAWTRRANLAEDLQQHQLVNLKFESNDDGRVFEFPSINLDESSTPQSGEPSSETRKPHVAGASAAD